MSYTMIDTRKQILKEIEVFLKASNMSRTQFGYEAVGDPGFVKSVEAGREPRFHTRMRVQRFITGAKP